MSEVDDEARTIGDDDTPLLVADGLSVRYGSTLALVDVRLVVQRGSSVAVLGPSGSGKSTLLHCLAGLLRPEAGSVRVAGRSLRELTGDELAVWRRNTVGLVFQQPLLLAELTVEENVMMPLLLTGSWTVHRARPRAREVMAELAIDELGGRLPGEVSGGQAQRVALARALAPNPRVLLCDEPTGALDSANAERVSGLLLEAARRRGTTVVAVTHDDSLTRRFDRTVWLRDGRVAPA